MRQIPKHKGFSSWLAVVFLQSIEAKGSVENEDVVGAAPTGDAPTTFEWSTIKLPTASYIWDLTVIFFQGPHSQDISIGSGRQLATREKLKLGCGPLHPVDLLHKSHSAPVPYPTMHHFVTEMSMCFGI